MSNQYVYQSIDSDRREIRLLVLLPGGFDAPLQLHIFHTPLIPPSDVKVTRISEDDLRKTLPSCCDIVPHSDERFLFVCSSHGVSERHPNPQFDQNVYSNLTHIPYSDFDPYYEALSYVWGSNTDSEEIIVRTSARPTKMVPLIQYQMARAVMKGFGLGISKYQDQISSLRVTRNLAHALRHLRHSTLERTLWIDAICIDQENVEERNEQVRRMADIFRLARRVLVWTDPSREGTASAIEIFNRLGPGLQEKARYLSETRLEEEDESNSGPNPLHLLSLEEWQSIAQFCSQPWFTRLWVFQEIKVANNEAEITCGAYATAWANFEATMRAVPTITSVPREYTQHEAPRSLTIYFNSISNVSFTDTLSYGSTLSCEDQRDHVYGLLSLTSDSLLSRFVIDYKKSKEEVFKQAMVVLMRYYKRCDPIRFCFLTNKPEGMPSWVRNWSTSEDMPFIFPTQFCTGFSRAEFTHEAPNILHIVGKSCGTICMASDPIPHDLQGLLRLVKQWQPSATVEESYITGGTVLDAFLFSLEKGLEHARFPGYWPFDDFKAEYTSVTHDPDASVSTMTSRIIGDLQHNLYARTFIRTAEGHIGLGPVGAREGDIVSIFLGCNSPIVLRPQSNGEFQVVGECYLHGISDSTALLGPLPTDWSVIGRATKESIVFRFLNAANGEETVHDPRLGALETGWEWIPSERTKDDPDIYEKFRNTYSGEEVNADPRMNSEALRRQGVDLVSFKLI